MGRKSYFLQAQYQGRRRWTRIGDADAMAETEARAQARSVLASVQKGREGVPAQPAAIAFEAVADEVFAHYRRRWKPRTLAVHLSYYENNILPWFKGRPVAGITRREVLEWFGSLHAKPASANRSLPVLSVILRRAEVYGYRPEDSNPCKDIKRYRRRARERFLSPDEIRRVVEVLNRYDRTRPAQAAVIRLLLLTGCRKGELLTLKSRDYREGKLFLRVSKTGPRQVLLGPEARAIIERQPGSGSPWVFPSPRKSARAHVDLGLWQKVWKLAGIEDVRLHDLRHTFASHAAMRGIPLPVVARLLGQAQVQMTLRYAHFSDRDVEAAAERIGGTMAEIMNGASPRPELADHVPPCGVGAWRRLR